MQDHLIVLRRNLEIVLGLPCSVHGRRIWQILFSLFFLYFLNVKSPFSGRRDFMDWICGNLVFQSLITSLVRVLLDALCSLQGTLYVLFHS